MKVHFTIRFHTKPGQSLAITGNIPELGNNDSSKAVPLAYYNNECWSGTVAIDHSRTARVRYKYILISDDGFQVAEWGNDRVIDTSKSGMDELQVIDTWNHAGEFENVFYTDPFQQILLRPQETRIKSKAPRIFTHIFKIKAPLLQKNEVPCLLGNLPALANWNTEEPRLLSRENGWWSVKVNLGTPTVGIEYKYGVYNVKQKEFVRYESGENRLIPADIQKPCTTLVQDGFIHLPNNSWKGAGVAIPVFSLRSRHSFGVGEFNDIRLLVDWARKTGLRLIQILPVNDTTATHSWLDSYPYAAISAFALHPIYINIESVAGKAYEDIIKPLRKKQKQLNEQADLDYEEVMKFKLSALRELFQLQKAEFLASKEFNEFFEQNRHWLVPYAAFSYLRDRNGSSDFNQWKMYSRYDRNAILRYVSPKAKHFADIAFHYFVQFHLHCQLKAAADYAHKQGIILKGDIPIGIYRYGCDAWQEPELYHMEMQAGAPPDDFAAHGQNWGFPTYNWAKMAEDGFEWWHRRFVQMNYYYDAFRIDHILGFFRIWSIPVSSVEGIMGKFDPALPVSPAEFEQWGIPFDRHRYCEPYITDSVLWELFGPNGEKFKPFLEETGTGGYRLNADFNSQRCVDAYFSKLENNEENRRIRQGLMDLISNIILFEEEGSQGTRFHFRFAIEKTTSFRHLPPYVGDKLKELYIDYFFKRQDEFWRKEAMKKLPALKASTNMLVCGEDLGLVPACVPDVMKQLGILSLEIQRMPKSLGHSFFRPAEAEYLSVVTPSTHDMSTIRGWWEEDRVRTQEFFNSELGQQGTAPYFCEPWINKAIVLQHLYSPSIWSIFQLQDLLGMSSELRRENPHEERINIPSNPKHYWKYRMHIHLEDLIKARDFNSELKEYVESAGR